MDESYLDWLRIAGSFDLGTARKIAKKFSSLEALVQSNPRELSSISGLSIPKAKNLLDSAKKSLRAKDSWYKDETSLFLCPECGSFIDIDAKECPNCGATFEGLERMEGPERKPRPEENQDEIPELYICSNCGAFLSREARKCPACGQLTVGIEAEEEAVAPEMVTDVSDAELRICPHCGAFITHKMVKCGICGRQIETEDQLPLEAEFIEEPEPKETRGVSKDFLARWKRIAEKAPSRETQLEDELQHYDELLKVDPRLEKAWVLKYHVLRELKRNKEAVKCLIKASQINPVKEEEYRKQALSLAKTVGDSSLVPQKWIEPIEVVKPKDEFEEVRKALDYYDRLLRTDPRLEMAWETRAELLSKLGKDAEAKLSLEKAKQVRFEKDESEKKALRGLKTIGVPPFRGRQKEGRVNGLVNGVGRVNGLVNGLGRVNGLVNGVGRVNGLVNGLGRVNGLVNGNGLTNGRKGRFQSVRVRERSGIKSLAGLASVIFVIMTAPILVSIFTPEPYTPPLQIDGVFTDWQGFPERPDPVLDTKDVSLGLPYKPEVDLVALKLTALEGQLALYTRMNANMFQTEESPVTSQSIEYLIVLIDTDGDTSTGYHVGNIGADTMVRISGWNGTLKGRAYLTWNANLGGGPNNISAFRHQTDIPAAYAGSELEFIVPMMDPESAQVLAFTANTSGILDSSFSIQRIEASTLLVDQMTLVGDIATQSQEPILKIELIADTGDVNVHGINISKSGSMSDSDVTISFYTDDGNGIFDAQDTDIGSSGFISGVASINTNLVVTRQSKITVFIVANLSTATMGSSLTLRVDEISSDSTVDIRDTGISGTYYQNAPTVTIDGAFGDWTQSMIQNDALWDVRSSHGSSSININIDIAEIGVNVTSDFNFYIKVHGRMLGGEDIPNLISRPFPSQFIDSDRDTVPDTLDLLSHDFNNDGISDDVTNGDVDNDGQIDYPQGSDFWLNTTIPGNFPSPFSGKVVSVYIGPISYNVPTGNDIAYAYIDSDNSSSTGLRSEVDGNTYGIDYALVARGREGILENSSLFKFTPNSNIPFTWMQSVNSAIDSQRMEMGVNASVLNLVPGYRVLAYTTDWMRNEDHSDEILTRGHQYGVRSINGDNVILNEIRPRKPNAWIELANPTSSSISLNGWRIELLKGRKYVELYRFSSEVIGAWLSGSEYLSADIPSNEMPNSNGLIVLRDASGTIVDETKYSSISSSSTWSRFKGSSDGKPVDTDSDSDWYVSNYPSRNSANDRTRPIISVAKTANAGSAEPGSFVMYTIYYNNTGDGLSKKVWINDTLPSDVTFWSSSVTPTSYSGQTYRWEFANVPPNTQGSFTITVQVTGFPPNGKLEKNTVYGNYTDQLNRKMKSSGSWANFTVVRPVINVEKTVSPSIAGPGDIVTYTIYYNNTGSINSATVWINDTLPDGVTFISSSVPYNSNDGQTYRWIFSNVGVGPHSFTITVIVDFTTNSSFLVNWVFLNYTSANGYKLEGSQSSTPLYIPEFEELLIPVLVPLLIILVQRYRGKKKEKGAMADSVPSTSDR